VHLAITLSDGGLVIAIPVVEGGFMNTGPFGHVTVVSLAMAALMHAPRAQAQVASFVFNQHAYRLYGDPDARSWANAASFAGSLIVGGQPGYLARIDDAGENAQIFQAMTANLGALTQTAPDGGGGRYVWIGANDRTTEGDWRWNDNNAAFWSGGPNGSAVGGLYNNWGSTAFGRSEPDNFPAGPAGQDAAAISVNGYPLGTAGQWNDIAESNVLPFVVEFNAVPEPSSAFMASAALALFAVSRRRLFDVLR
jgi:hypothetical protein